MGFGIVSGVRRFLARQVSDVKELSLLPAGEANLKEAIASADPKQYRNMMVALGVPADIAGHVVDLTTEDQDRTNTALMACYGRLQFLQPAGLFAAQVFKQQIGLTSSPRSQLPQLSIAGAMKTDALLSRSQAAETVAFLRTRPVYNGHVPEASADGIGRMIGGEAEAYPFGSHSTDDVFSAPHLIEAVLSPKILSLAEAHLGCAPTLSALQAWWNFSEHRENVVRDKAGSATEYAPQNYHRDLNDFRMFWIYMYLTDVDDDCGPHQVLASSGDISEIVARGSNIPGFDPQSFFYQYGYQIPYTHLEQMFGDKEQTFLGPAGATFFSNGFNFHRIRYPLKKPRLMFAARFSIQPSMPDRKVRKGEIPTGASIASRLSPTPLLRYATRHLVDW